MMLKSLVRLGAITCALLLGGAAMAQGVVQQVGPVTAGNAVVWSRNGQIMDGGATAVASTGSYNWTGKQTFGPSTTASASVNVSPGPAPVTPVNGDIWTTSSGIYAAINGLSVNLATPNLATTGPGGVIGTLPTANGGTGLTGTPASGQYLVGTGSGYTLVTPSQNETPSGSINGSNVTFTLAHTPYNGVVMLYYNGILLESGSGNDFTISGNTITMVYALPIGSKLRAYYSY